MNVNTNFPRSIMVIGVQQVDHWSYDQPYYVDFKRKYAVSLWPIGVFSVMIVRTIMNDHVRI